MLVWADTDVNSCVPGMCLQSNLPEMSSYPRGQGLVMSAPHSLWQTFIPILLHPVNLFNGPASEWVPEPGGPSLSDRVPEITGVEPGCRAFDRLSSLVFPFSLTSPTTHSLLWTPHILTARALHLWGTFHLWQVSFPSQGCWCCLLVWWWEHCHSPILTTLRVMMGTDGCSCVFFLMEDVLWSCSRQTPRCPRPPSPSLTPSSFPAACAFRYNGLSFVYLIYLLLIPLFSEPTKATMQGKSPWLSAPGRGTSGGPPGVAIGRERCRSSGELGYLVVMSFCHLQLFFPHIFPSRPAFVGLQRVWKVLELNMWS